MPASGRYAPYGSVKEAIILAVAEAGVNGIRARHVCDAVKKRGVDATDEGVRGVLSRLCKIGALKRQHMHYSLAK